MVANPQATRPEYICREWVDEVFIRPDAIGVKKNKLRSGEMGVVVHEQLMLESGVGQKQLIKGTSTLHGA